MILKKVFLHFVRLSLVTLVSFSLVAIWSYDSSALTANIPVKGLTVSPLRTELTIDPGTSQDKTLTLSNTNNHPIVVHLSTEEFSVINQQYDYAFNVETQLIKWVTFTPDMLNLAVGETKTVTFRISVPLSAEPGGRYLSLFATTDAGSVTDGITSRQRIASLVYATVNGDVSRSGHLVSLNTPWITTGPSTWSAALQNTGTTHYSSRYNIVVRPLYGSDEITGANGSALILPGTIRLISDTLPLPQLPGIYKIVFTIGLGDTPAQVETKYIVYLPPVAIIMLLFGLILVGSLVSEYRSRKKKKANQSAEQQYK